MLTKFGFEGFAVGQVKEVRKHPNTDKFTLAKGAIGCGMGQQGSRLSGGFDAQLFQGGQGLAVGGVPFGAQQGTLYQVLPMHV